MSSNDNGLRSIALPVTPVFPATVATGDIIRSGPYGNTVTQALKDLWTDIQAIAALTTPVTSVFGRTGAIVAQAGDYTAAMVTGAVPNTRRVIAGAGLAGGGDLTVDRTLTANVQTVFGRTGNVVLTSVDLTGAGGVPSTRQILVGAGLTGGGDLSVDRTLGVVDDSTTQRIRVSQNGTLAGTRPALNFIPGANVGIVAIDNAAANRIDITINSVGGSGGAAQSPWISDIDAANNTLYSARRIFVGLGSSAAVGGYGAASVNITAAPGLTGQCITSFGAAGVLALQSARGAEGGALASVAGDLLGMLAFRGYTGLDFTTRRASVIGLAAETWTATANGASLAFETTAAGSTAVREVARFSPAGHLLVNTINDGPHLVRVNGTICSISGGFVFPDGTTQISAATSTPQTPWTQNIDAAGFALFNVDYVQMTNVCIIANDGNAIIQFRNAANLVRWALNKEPAANGGNFSILAYDDAGAFKGTPVSINRSTLQFSINNGLRFPDASVQTTAYTKAAAQTPWTQNIDGGGFALTNTLSVTAASTPTSAAGVAPSLQLRYAQDAAHGGVADQQYWRFFTGNNSLIGDCVNDAFTAGNPWIQVFRIGAVPQYMMLPINVMVGTNNAPSEKLHVSGGGRSYLRLDDTTNNVNLSAGCDTAAARIGTFTNHPLHLYANGTARMSFYETGGVDVFTTQFQVTGGVIQARQSGSGGQIWIAFDDAKQAGLIRSWGPTTWNRTYLVGTDGEALRVMNGAQDGFVFLGYQNSSNIGRVGSYNSGWRPMALQEGAWGAPVSIGSATVPYNARCLAITAPNTTIGNAGSGNATVSIGLGPAQSDEALLIGYDGTTHVSPFGWIQCAKPGTASRPLSLNPNGGGVVLSCAQISNLTNFPASNLMFYQQAVNTLTVWVKCSDGSQRSVTLTLT